MKLPIAVLLLALATATAATSSCSSKSPPTDYPAILARYASKPLVDDYYPPASRELKEQGTTKIRFCYDEHGMPSVVTLNESSGFERLDEAAVSWGKAVRVTPGIMRGKPQPACLEIPVKFSLEKSQQLPAEDEELLPPFFEPPPVPSFRDMPLPPPPAVPIPLAPSSPPGSIGT